MAKQKTTDRLEQSAQMYSGETAVLKTRNVRRYYRFMEEQKDRTLKKVLASYSSGLHFLKIGRRPGTRLRQADLVDLKRMIENALAIDRTA